MKQKLLIIGNDKNMRELLCMEFSDEGYQVLAAEDAYKAFSILSQRQVDLILIDLKPQGLDEIDAFVKMKNQYQYLPVVIYTGYRHSKENHLAWQTVDYVIKSGNLDTLKTTVKKHLVNS